ncbi:MAG TPA: hypothetical protein VFD58_13450 [Blastocatellia bacterium]|nr:hypothetical protein [Blastocatellia bacterium]
MTRRLCTFICLLALLCPIVPGQSPAPQNGQSNEQSAADSQKLIIPEGTELQLSLREPLSSKLNEPGDEVYAVIRRDVVIEGRTLIRQGTEVIGRVTAAQPAKRMLKGGMLHVTFDRIRLDGGEQRLTTVIKSAADFARDEKIKTDGEGSLKGGKSGGDVLKNVGTAATIGGVGATIIILSSADRDAVGTGRGVRISRGGAIAGASVLGASVIAGVLLTKGKEVRLDQGAIIRLKLERSLAVG